MNYTIETKLDTHTLWEARREFERTYLLLALERCGNNVTNTAKAVSMERAALHRKMKKLGILAPRAVTSDNVL
jgi:two-component system nitrogen regulation response regulator NtrX